MVHFHRKSMGNQWIWPFELFQWFFCLISHCLWYTSYYAHFTFTDTIWPLSLSSDFGTRSCTYRTQPCLVTNLVMNLVTNLVITKFGDEFGDIFVTLFGDSLNLVMILMTFSSPHLVGHQISCTFHHAIAKAAGQILPSLFKKKRLLSCYPF